MILLAKADIKSRLFWMDIGYILSGSSDQYHKAVRSFEKVETISAEWGGDWKFSRLLSLFRKMPAIKPDARQRSDSI